MAIRSLFQQLTEDDVRHPAAQDFADFMAKTVQSGHNADGQTPGDRVQTAGYEICDNAENITMKFHSNGFATYSLVKAFFKEWQDCPPHQANMLQANVTQTEVAISQSPVIRAYFAVQLFGRPRSQANNIQIHDPLEAEILYKLGEETYQLPST